MSLAIRSRRRAVVLFGVLAVGGPSLWFALPATRVDTSEGAGQDYPELFGVRPPCSSHAHALERASRLERHGHLHAQRYPYDPADGVRAVHRFQLAQSCYEAAGMAVDAERVRANASELVARVDTDYAAARIVLLNALESERWSAALVETRRLLRLTAHLSKSGYGEWLEGIVGKVAVRASEAP